MRRESQFIGEEPDVGKTDGKRRGWQRRMWLDGITNSMDMNLSKLQDRVKTGEPGVPQSMGSQRVGYDLATEQQAPRISKYQSTAPSSLPSSRPYSPPQNSTSKSSCLKLYLSQVSPLLHISHLCWWYCNLFVLFKLATTFILSNVFFGDMHWGHNSKHSKVPSLMNLVFVGEMDYS